MDASLVSIVIPVYNAAAFLAETLESVFAQDHRAIEVILVDDGSTDRSLAIARGWAPSLRVLHQANAGPAAARNRGIELARGDYLAFIDADDRWPQGRLARQLAILKERPELDMVMGLVEVEYPDQAPRSAARFRAAGAHIAFFSFGAGLFRRRLFDRVGLLSEALRNTEDADWFMRAREIGASWLLENDLALIYRRHGANMTEHLPLAKSEVFRVLARATARHRARVGTAPPMLDRLSDRRATFPGGEKEKDR
jgi:glycosyltransferase involved in cell wall biosynthesis